jgi:hypothetical protein
LIDPEVAHMSELKFVLEMPVSREPENYKLIYDYGTNCSQFMENI